MNCRMCLFFKTVIGLQRGGLRGSLISVKVCSGVLTSLHQCENVTLTPRTMLGPIAAPGGSVFALLVLIVLALVGDYPPSSHQLLLFGKPYQTNA